MWGQWTPHISIMTLDMSAYIDYDMRTMESAYRLCHNRHGTMESAHIDYDMGQWSLHISIMTWDNVRTYRLLHGTMESAHIDYDMGQCPHISIMTWDNGLRTYRL